MITIPRSLARRVRAVFRRLLRKADSWHARIVLQAAPDGLRIRLHHPEFFAQYHQPGSHPPEVLILPLDAFARCEGAATPRCRWSAPTRAPFGSSGRMASYPNSPNTKLATPTR